MGCIARISLVSAIIGACILSPLAASAGQLFPPVDDKDNQVKDGMLCSGDVAGGSGGVLLWDNAVKSTDSKTKSSTFFNRVRCVPTQNLVDTVGSPCAAGTYITGITNGVPTCAPLPKNECTPGPNGEPRALQAIGPGNAAPVCVNVGTGTGSITGGNCPPGQYAKTIGTDGAPGCEKPAGMNVPSCASGYVLTGLNGSLSCTPVNVNLGSCPNGQYLAGIINGAKDCRKLPSCTGGQVLAGVKADGSPDCKGIPGTNPLSVASITYGPLTSNETALVDPLPADPPAGKTSPLPTITKLRDDRAAAVSAGKDPAVYDFNISLYEGMTAGNARQASVGNNPECNGTDLSVLPRHCGVWVENCWSDGSYNPKGGETCGSIDLLHNPFLRERWLVVFRKENDDEIRNDEGFTVPGVSAAYRGQTEDV